MSKKTDDDLFRLYELPEQYERLGELLAESGGELTPEIEEFMDGFQDNLETKCERIAALIQRAQRQAEGAKAEADRLSRLSQIRQKGADKLKHYMLYCLTEMGREKVETPLFVIRRQNNPVPEIEWLGAPDEIPPLFRKEPPPPPDPELDKKKVTALWRWQRATSLLAEARRDGDPKLIEKFQQMANEAFAKLPLEFLEETEEAEYGAATAPLPEQLSVHLKQHLRIA